MAFVIAVLAATGAAVAHWQGLIRPNFDRDTFCHGVPYSGRSSCFDGYEAEQELDKVLDKTRNDLLQRASTDTEPRPPGWMPMGSRTYAKDPYLRCRASPLWHSSITLLWRHETQKLWLWYPGGRLSEGSGGLEWRECPEK